MNTKFNVEAMFFPGFYNTVLSVNEDEVEMLKDNELLNFKEMYPGIEITSDDLDFNYDAYEQKVAKHWTNAYYMMLPEIVESCKFESINHPRNTGYGPDYRFRNDKLYLDVELSDDWFTVMKDFINDHREWFESRLKDDWTSYDGFMSFLENTVDGWIKGLEDEDERYIGTMLGYMVYIENNCDKYLTNSLCSDALDDVNIYEFIELTSEKQSEVNSKKNEIEKLKRIQEWEKKHQLSINFPN